MADVNCITVTGRLTRDALRKMAGNSVVTTFSIANNIGFGDYAKTNFYTVNLWGQRGEKLVEYLKKGNLVGVVGQESLNVWTGGDGVEHSDRVITAHDITLLPSAKKVEDGTISAEQIQEYSAGVF